MNNNGKLRIATETPSSTCRTLSQPLANHDSPPRFEIITARQASRVPEFAGGDQTPLPVLSPLISNSIALSRCPSRPFFFTSRGGRLCFFCALCLPLLRRLGCISQPTFGPRAFPC